jgi:L-threonylcarbamoyladenylate synthase
MEILRTNPKNFKKIIKKAEESIKEGKVLICPTDTVYGLIADATNKRAVKKIFKIKKRSFKKPVPIFIKDIKMAKKIAQIDENQEKLLRKYWPGKITVILRLKRKPSPGQRSWAGFPKGIGKLKKEIGLRIPNYNFLKILLKRLNFPLAQTSANISGNMPIKNIKIAMKLFNKKKNKPDLIIDGGVLKNKPSTIIDLTEFPPKILSRS